MESSHSASSGSSKGQKTGVGERRLSSQVMDGAHQPLLQLKIETQFVLQKEIQVDLFAVFHLLIRQYCTIPSLMEWQGGNSYKFKHTTFARFFVYCMHGVHAL